MAQETKALVDKDQSFDLLEARLGRITEVALEPSAPKKAYRLTIDFGKFGVRTSVGRFAQHTEEELVGVQVIGILNFGARMVGDVQSDVLILGVQYPKAESGEATPLTPLSVAKLGGKVF